jgi:hypothetical protein
VRSLGFLIAIASAAWAAEPGATLISRDEADPIRSAIIRKEAWTLDSARLLRSDAERRMKEGPWSVTAERPKEYDPDPHEYYSESPFYWPVPDKPGTPYVRRSGQPNPERFAANHTAMNAMADAVFTLSSAALLLDNPAYARRAARVVNAWFINPKTRMNPGMERAHSIPGGGPTAGGAVEGRPLIRAIQGMEFLTQTGTWDPKDEAAVRKWFEDYLRWLMPKLEGPTGPRGEGDRGSPWWTAQAAAVATFVDDEAALKRVFTHYGDRLPPRRPRLGALRQAFTRSLAVSVLDLDADAIVCRVAQLHGMDLWRARLRQGSGISAQIDALISALTDPKRQGRDQPTDLRGGELHLLAFAAMGLDKPEYLALYRKMERPTDGWLAVIDLLVGRWEASAHQTRH